VRQASIARAPFSSPCTGLGPVQNAPFGPVCGGGNGAARRGRDRKTQVLAWAVMGLSCMSCTDVPSPQSSTAGRPTASASFGYDARKNLVEQANALPDAAFEALVRRAERAIKTKPRKRPPNIKNQIVVDRGYSNLRLESEELVDFDYLPVACRRPYRIVALRKNLIVEKGQTKLFDEVRYFFYITNERELSNEQVIRQANQRCNQENLIAQLKSGVRALHAPVNTLNANGAYMLMASLAWTLKAWAALSLSVHPRWRHRHEQQRQLLLRMEFRTFLNAFINVPAQIIRTSRRVIYRLLGYNPSQLLFFRMLDGIGVPS
jgi:hypothetical protein